MSFDAAKSGSSFKLTSGFMGTRLGRHIQDSATSQLTSRLQGAASASAKLDVLNELSRKLEKRSDKLKGEFADQLAQNQKCLDELANAILVVIRDVDIKEFKKPLETLFTQLKIKQDDVKRNPQEAQHSSSDSLKATISKVSVTVDNPRFILQVTDLADSREKRPAIVLVSQQSSASGRDFTENFNPVVLLGSRRGDVKFNPLYDGGEEEKSDGFEGLPDGALIEAMGDPKAFEPLIIRNEEAARSADSARRVADLAALPPSQPVALSSEEETRADVVAKIKERRLNRQQGQNPHAAIDDLLGKFRNLFVIVADSPKTDGAIPEPKEFSNTFRDKVTYRMNDGEWIIFKHVSTNTPQIFIKGVGQADFPIEELGKESTVVGIGDHVYVLRQGEVAEKSDAFDVLDRLLEPEDTIDSVPVEHQAVQELEEEAALTTSKTTFSAPPVKIVTLPLSERLDGPPVAEGDHANDKDLETVFGDGVGSLLEGQSETDGAPDVVGDLSVAQSKAALSEKLTSSINTPKILSLQQVGMLVENGAMKDKHWVLYKDQTNQIQIHIKGVGHAIVGDGSSDVTFPQTVRIEGKTYVIREGVPAQQTATPSKPQDVPVASSQPAAPLPPSTAPLAFPATEAPKLFPDQITNNIITAPGNFEALTNPNEVLGKDVLFRNVRFVVGGQEDSSGRVVRGKVERIIPTSDPNKVQLVILQEGTSVDDFRRELVTITRKRAEDSLRPSSAAVTFTYESRSAFIVTSANKAAFKEHISSMNGKNSLLSTLNGSYLITDAEEGTVYTLFLIDP